MTRSRMFYSKQKNKKSVSLTDVFLLIASGIIDFYQEIKDPFNLISNYYQNTFGYTPPRWKKNSLLRVFKYCIKKRYLNKNSNFLSCKFIINKKGEEKIYKKYPALLYSEKNWDKKLRLVIFDIREIEKNKRDKLRRTIKNLGFIMIQKSVWLSPFNQFQFIKKWLKTNNIEEKVLLIEASQINIKNKDKLISSFWQTNYK